MIVIYCPRVSEGAIALRNWFREHGEKSEKVKTDRYLQYAPRLVIAWGNRLPRPFKLTLNAEAPIGNKFRELQILREKGVYCPSVSLDKKNGWFVRMKQHHSANDLLKELTRGDYYVEPIKTTTEFRVHVFKDEPFRTAIKIPHSGAHPTFRTNSAGWGISYNQSDLEKSSTMRQRETAREASAAAVKALAYDFGAVDVGLTEGGKAVVFEVNSAPGLEGVSIERYGARILAFARGEKYVKEKKAA